MPSQREIKSAIDVLSQVTEYDISGLEADFSLAAMKFGEFYRNYINKTIARDHAIDYLLSVKITPCPDCKTTNSVNICIPTVTVSDFNSYCDDKSKMVAFGSESQDEKGFDQDIVKIIDQFAPHLSFKTRDHLYCWDCNLYYDPKGCLDSLWSMKIPFTEIVTWVNNGKKKLGEE